MMDSLKKLWEEREECCSIFETIVMQPPAESEPEVAGFELDEEELPGTESMNPSQIAAIRSCSAPLSLIWGPPGTLLSSSHGRWPTL
jgi:hypothetical protein